MRRWRVEGCGWIVRSGERGRIYLDADNKDTIWGCRNSGRRDRCAAIILCAICTTRVSARNKCGDLRKGVNCYSAVFVFWRPYWSAYLCRHGKGRGNHRGWSVCLYIVPSTCIQFTELRSILWLQTSPMMCIFSTLTCAEQMPLITI